MRTSRYLFSETFNPWMRGVAILVDVVANNWMPVPQDHPLLKKEREFIDQVSKAMENARQARDGVSEQIFDQLYGVSRLTVTGQ
jgi:hypothetical protein